MDRPKPDGGGRDAGAALEPSCPVEIALADGTVLRGVEHPADGPPLLFLHDLGEDLDTWRQVAPAVRAAGFRVICLELRGHGLSDGEPDPAAIADDVTAALAEVRGAFGPAGLVVCGTAAQVALELGSEQGAPVHALISPSPSNGSDQRTPVTPTPTTHTAPVPPAGAGDPTAGTGSTPAGVCRATKAPVSGSDDPATGAGSLKAGEGGAAVCQNAGERSARCMRVVFTGAQDEPVHEYVRAIHPRLRGQNMWISTGSARRGAALLREHPHLIEQLVMFMRRHLTAHHLAWIAQQTRHRKKL